MRISVEITTLNRHSEIALLLQSLREQTCQEFDIVIIDGSTLPDKRTLNPCWGSSFVHSLLTRMKLEGHGIITETALIAENCKQRNQAIKADAWQNPLICRVDDDVILAPDYLERLLFIIGKGYDLASGVTPPIGAVDFKRDPKHLNGIVNKIEYDAEGNITTLGDDCGMLYLDNGNPIYPAHHLRSCFMYKRKIHDESNIFYETPGRVAFREETEFCLRAAYAGYKLGVDLQAIAWHLIAPSGGCRTEEYAQQVQLNDFRFRQLAKRWYKTKGCPFK